MPFPPHCSKPLKPLTALFLGLSLTSCSTPAERVADSGNAAGSPTTVVVTRTVEETAPSTPSDAPSSSDAPTTVAPSSGDLAALGSASGYEYNDGLVISVPMIGTYQPSRYAVGAKKGNTGVRVTVEIKNGTNKVVDPVLVSLSMTYGVRGNQAEQIFDSSNGIGDGFTTQVPPGRISTADFAFSVPRDEIADLILEISPDYTHDSALFQGSAE